MYNLKDYGVRTFKDDWLFMKVNDRISCFPRSHLIPQKLRKVTITPTASQFCFTSWVWYF